MACIGVRSAQTLSDRFPEQVTGSFEPKADFAPQTYVTALQRLQLFRDLFRASQNYLDIGVALRQGDCAAVRPTPWHVLFTP